MYLNEPNFTGALRVLAGEACRIRFCVGYRESDVHCELRGGFFAFLALHAILLPNLWKKRKPASNCMGSFSKGLILHILITMRISVGKTMQAAWPGPVICH